MPWRTLSKSGVPGSAVMTNFTPEGVKEGQTKCGKGMAMMTTFQWQAANAYEVKAFDACVP